MPQAKTIIKGKEKSGKVENVVKNKGKKGGSVVDNL